jgi:CDP-diglyceride synthetase
VLHLVGQAFWLSLPVALTGILHMVVVKARLFPALAVPLDGGRLVGGKPIFGPNKTWRGVVVMIVGSALVGAVQGLWGGPWAQRSGVACVDFPALGLGFAGGYAALNAVHGLGYALGELPNSFAKRRIDITPGKTGAGLVGAVFFLLDQADSVIAALVLGALTFGYAWRIVAVGVVCLTLLHLAINAGLYAGKVRKNL